ncbi:MAG TPA: hypothetical protein VLI92_01445 [Candidatus Saccharimonadales bacterium]|nr:hypothetical protein [Candidatus Saccharimonadales bacterium]
MPTKTSRLQVIQTILISQLMVALLGIFISIIFNINLASAIAYQPDNNAIGIQVISSMIGGMVVAAIMLLLSRIRLGTSAIFAILFVFSPAVAALAYIMTLGEILLFRGL